MGIPVYRKTNIQGYPYIGIPPYITIITFIQGYPLSMVSACKFTSGSNPGLFGYTLSLWYPNANLHQGPTLDSLAIPPSYIEVETGA